MTCYQRGHGRRQLLRAMQQLGGRVMEVSREERDPKDVYKRQGYGMLTLQGKSYRIPFNVYEDKQAEEIPGDPSPGVEDAEQ